MVHARALNNVLDAMQTLSEEESTSSECVGRGPATKVTVDQISYVLLTLNLEGFRCHLTDSVSALIHVDSGANFPAPCSLKTLTSATYRNALQRIHGSTSSVEPQLNDGIRLQGLFVWMDLYGIIKFPSV